MSDAMRTCENCNRTIGRLERVYEYRGHTVCRECRNRLVVMTPLPTGEVGGRLEQRAAALNQPEAAGDDTAGQSDDEEPEETVWTGTPSQWTNIKAFALCVLAEAALWVIGAVFLSRVEGEPVRQAVWLSLLPLSLVPVLTALWYWLMVRHTRYKITSQRLLITTGIFSRATEEVELFRIKDTALVEPFLLRLVGLGHVMLMSSDRTMPTVVLRAVPKARSLRETVRRVVDKRRTAKRVREVDME